MRLLVCGGRDFEQDDVVNATLDELRPSLIIHGDAAGADQLADRWAVRNYIPVLRFRADWYAHGKAAGPIRNQKMLVEGKPDLVVAFPGGKGTADMVRRAQAANVRVV